MRSPRTVIAFAYVHDQFTKTNDIAVGLIPLFAPIISARAGKPFDPMQFVRDVKTLYDLDMHPYVAEELAPSLAQHGYLIAERRVGSTPQYVNRSITLPEPPVGETQLRDLVDTFIKFSQRYLQTSGLSATGEQLEAAFFDRLLRPDFLALVLRPDGKSVSPWTITLPGARAPTPPIGERDEEHFDYLVARFILALHEQKSPQFELLVAATSGSLVAEVVLDLQHPPKPGESLSGVSVAIDSPLILDALGLGQDGATDYATMLVKQIEQAGAKAVVFDATIEEMGRVLRATLQNYDRKQDLYGPLGHRLRSDSALAAYVRAILPTLREEIQKLGISACPYSQIDRAAGRKYFTGTNEEGLAQKLGEYPTEEARAHDAQTVSDVIRIRGDAKAAGLRDSRIVFVTRNTKLARMTRRYLTDAALAARDYFPPCITDRYLAGILWITTGGGGESLSRLRLVANCSAAVVPRREIVSRLHQFLEKLNPALVSRFEALMTNERAEHFLMDRTLADASLITQTNYEEIYRDVENVAAERVTRQKDEEIAAIKAAHAAQLAREMERAQEMGATAEQWKQRAADVAIKSDQALKTQRDKLFEETTRLTLLESDLRDTEAAAAEAERNKQVAEQKLRESNRRWAEACLLRGRNAARLTWLCIIACLALVAAATAAFAGDTIASREATFGLTLVVTIGLSLVGAKYWPDNFLERWIQTRRQDASDAYAERHGVTDAVSSFDLDWERFEVRDKQATDSQTSG